LAILGMVTVDFSMHEPEISMIKDNGSNAALYSRGVAT
jgi:hypothetical protein